MLSWPRNALVCPGALGKGWSVDLSPLSGLFQDGPLGKTATPAGLQWSLPLETLRDGQTLPCAWQRGEPAQAWALESGLESYLPAACVVWRLTQLRYQFPPL